MSLSRNHQHYPPFLQDTMLVEQSIYISKYCQQGPDPGTNPGRIGPCRQSSLKKPLTFQRETDFHNGLSSYVPLLFSLNQNAFHQEILSMISVLHIFFHFPPTSGGKNGSLIQAVLFDKLSCLYLDITLLILLQHYSPCQ